jgi:protein-disulfide isomerase
MRFTLVVVLLLWVALPSCRRDSSLITDWVHNVPGYELAATDVALRETFLKILHTEHCPCGHPHHVARCLHRDKPRCQDSHLMARFALRRLRTGDSMSRVVLMLDRMFQQGEKAVSIPVDGAPVRGVAEAPLTLVAFTDFQCPFCKKAQEMVQRLLDAHPGKLRLIFKHLPLKRHRRAMLASQAAVAAQNQGKFWEMHDLLFENQKELSREGILEFAKRLKLDTPRFEQELDLPQTRARIEAEAELAKKIGVKGTPAFYLNGRKVNGATTFEDYRDYAEVELDRIADRRPAP